MTLRYLHKVTQIPYSDLSQALVSLTAPGQNILTPVTWQEQQEGSKEPSAEPSADEEAATVNTFGRDESGKFVTITRFRSTARFMLNEDFIKSVGSGSMWFKDVRVVTDKERFSRKSLAEVIDRRKDIIDAAIVRMLKREKEKSLDSIAATVIEGCAAGRFEPGLSFGRFECDYRDVCYRVFRLIKDGYLYRGGLNQQLVGYIPDNLSATQHHVSVPGPEDQRLQAPPPADPFVRKPKPADPFLPKVCEEDDSVPSLAMVATSLTQDPSTVEATMRATVTKFSEILALDEDITEHLLNRCFWRKMPLLNAYDKDYSNLLSETGLAPVGATTPAPPFPPLEPGKKSTCKICLQIHRHSEFFSLWCGHFCCSECWAQQVKNRLNMNHVYGVHCIQFKCKAAPTKGWLIKNFGAESKTVKLYQDALFREYIKTSGWETWCTNPQGCDRILRTTGVKTTSCHKCGWNSCTACDFVEGHEPVSCHMMQRWIANQGVYLNMNKDALSQHVAALISKKCPSCSVRIERSEGCMHMHCKCGHHFCWRCLKPWNPIHTDFFICKSEYSQYAKDEKMFSDYNHRVTGLQKPRIFAEKLCVLVKGISEKVPIKTLSFLIDACQLLVQCHKMLGYAFIAEFYLSQDKTPLTPDYLSFLTESLEGDTHALQAFLENALLSQPDLARSIRTMPERRLLEGYRLVGKIEGIREKLLIGQHNYCKIGVMSPVKQEERIARDKLLDQEWEE